MPGEMELPSESTRDVEAASIHVRRELQDLQATVSRFTGGASPRAVLAELAQELASDLAAYFDALPMEAHLGRIARIDGPLRWIVPSRRVPHRTVLARYLSATPPSAAGLGYTAAIARIAVLTIGADGVLRTGIATEKVHLPENVELTLDPVPWDDPRIRRVPTGTISLARWTGQNEPHAVASPGRVIEALTAIASLIAQESKRDLALLQRFL